MEYNVKRNDYTKTYLYRYIIRQKYNKYLIITINQEFLINKIPYYYFFQNTFMIMVLKSPRV